MTAVASGSSSPTTVGCPRRKRTSRCTGGARTSARPIVALNTILTASLLARSRCVPVQRCETRLTGLVLAAAQGDRLRLHRWRRIRQLKTQSKPSYSLGRITISEVAPRSSELNVLQQIDTHTWMFQPRAVLTFMIVIVLFVRHNHSLDTSTSQPKLPWVASLL